MTDSPASSLAPAVGSTTTSTSAETNHRRSSGGATTAPGLTTTTRAADDTSTTTTVFHSTGPKCPDPRTCDVYQLTAGKGWRPGADGVARIPVSINPAPPAGSALSADTVEADLLAMMAMWEEASPSVRFRYLGRTIRQPRLGDGFSDLAHGSRILERRDGDGYLIEADAVPDTYSNRNPMSAPCHWHRDGDCGPTGTDIQETRQLYAHELGHVLGAADLQSTETAELTMDHSSRPPGDRRRVTLGLGDVLFVRHLYPCGCPLPRIHVP